MRIYTHRKNILHLKPRKVHILEFEDALFRHNSAALLPDTIQSEDSSDNQSNADAEQSRISGLEMIQAILGRQERFPQQKILIAGHTDTSGSDAYNMVLSKQRAESVLHIMEGNKKKWVDIVNSKHKEEDIQHILKWMNKTFYWHCDPGKIDGQIGEQTKNAIKSFQKSFSDNYGPPIEVDGDFGPQSWGAVFYLYQVRLASMMGVDGFGLIEKQNDINWANRKFKAIGCGENWPIEAVGKDNYRSQTNRRVEILFFDPDEVPIFNCPSACGSDDCCIYGKINGKDRYQREYLPVENVVDYDLESDFAMEYFSELAKKMPEPEFIAWCADIYGYDIDIEFYKKLRQDFLDGAFPDAEISLNPSSHRGHLAWYDKEKRTIFIHKDLPESARENYNDAWRLILILVEEFGHHVDNMLRSTDYSGIGGDADMDEGARTAYSLVYWEFEEQKKKQFATYFRLGSQIPLYVDYEDVHEYVKKYISEEDQLSDEQDYKREYWGAGMGRGDCSYAHKKLEQILASVGFDEQELNKIYFGNWMRDFSQILDPKTVRKEDELITYKFRRVTLTYLVFILAQTEFASEERSEHDKVTLKRLEEDWERIVKDGGDESAVRNPAFLVTEDRLGVYRAEEHIDNPYGIEDGSHIDDAFRKDCTDKNLEELQTDPSTWMKNYIAANGDFTTSAEYARDQLKLAKQHGRNANGLRHFGAALHTLEDLYAHSNFVELALIELGIDAIPWVKKMSNGYFPLTTGIFAAADTIASVGIILAEHFEKNLVCLAGERSELSQVILILLEDQGELKWRDRLDIAMTAMEDLARDHPKLATFMCRNVDIHLHFLKIAFGLVIHEALNQIDDFQSLEEGGNPEFCTHSQLTKDHDDHPLHELGAFCAMELVRNVGQAMIRTWEGEMSVEELQEIACSYFFHPAKIRYSELDYINDLRVYFGVGSSALNNEAIREGGPIDQVSQAFEDPNLEIAISGHTDDTGSLELNLALSTQRAESVRDRLINFYGIPSSKMTIIGMGPNFPEFPNDSPENREKNRRVEFQVMNSSTLQSRILHVISSYAGHPRNEEKIKKACSPGFIIEQYGRAMKQYEEFKEFFEYQYEELKKILEPEE